jgi:hypothetical protein
MPTRIKHNKIRCRNCGDTIESTHRHDFRYCKCGLVAVDGGRDYLRRVGEFGNWEEISEEEEYDPEEKVPIRPLSTRELLLLFEDSKEPKILGGRLE